MPQPASQQVVTILYLNGTNISDRSLGFSLGDTDYMTERQQTAGPMGYGKPYLPRRQRQQNFMAWTTR